MKDKLEAKRVKPHQLGWLRRPEMDRDGIQVWEKPCGALYGHHGREPLMLEVLRKIRPHEDA